MEGVCGCGGGSQLQSWTYDDQLNNTSKTNALNQTASYTYDTNGNRLTETNSLGTTSYRDFQYQFNQVNNITQMSDGAVAHNYGYDLEKAVFQTDTKSRSGL